MSEMTFEQVSQAFEDKEATDSLRKALVLKPIRREPVKQVTHAPNVKRMVLAISRAYPMNRSYI